MSAKDNYTVVITRSEEQSSALEAALKEKGYGVFLFPSIKIDIKSRTEEIDSVLGKLVANKFDWLVATSVNGVRALHQLMEEQSLPENLKVALVGERTEKEFIDLFGRKANLLPQEFFSESLIKSFQAEKVTGVKILLIQGDKNRDVLEVGLKGLGAEVDKVTLYQNSENESVLARCSELKQIPAEKLIFVFFSPSAVTATRRFLGNMDGFLEKAKIISIGPVTTASLESNGLKPAFEIAEHSEIGVIQAILEKFPVS